MLLKNHNRTPSEPENPESRLAVVLPIAAAVLLALPALVVRYMPMTDLPQHLAIVSIIKNIDNPLFGFSEYYEVSLNRSLYLLPYLIVVALSHVMPLEFAMRTLVFIMLLMYPLGVLAILRVRRRPAAFALLVLPVVYNSTVFWGFIHFNFGVGMSLFAIALFARDRRTTGSDLTLALLCTLIVFTHMYGLFILFGYVALSVLLGDRRQLSRRLLPLAPAAVGLSIWFRFAADARHVGVVQTLGFVKRITSFEQAVLGGYKDSSETYILIALALTFLFFCFPSFPIQRKLSWRWNRHESIFLVYVALNLFLYLVLPLNLPAARCFNLRHAVLAFVFLPLLMPVFRLRRFPRMGNAVLVGLALSVVGNSWYHILKFDYESGSFDIVMLYIERKPRLLSVSLDNNGEYQRSHPYVHYAAYVQAKKGGIISMSFAHFAWISPVRERKEANIPATPDGFEWIPMLYDYKQFGKFYDHVLVRAPNQLKLPEATFPFHLIFKKPPWWLYRANTSREKAAPSGYPRPGGAKGRRPPRVIIGDRSRPR